MDERERKRKREVGILKREICIHKAKREKEDSREIGGEGKRRNDGDEQKRCIVKERVGRKRLTEK